MKREEFEKEFLNEELRKEIDIFKADKLKEVVLVKDFLGNVNNYSPGKTDYSDALDVYKSLIVEKLKNDKSIAENLLINNTKCSSVLYKNKFKIEGLDNPNIIIIPEEKGFLGGINYKNYLIFECNNVELLFAHYKGKYKDKLFIFTDDGVFTFKIPPQRYPVGGFISFKDDYIEVNKYL